MASRTTQRDGQFLAAKHLFWVDDQTLLIQRNHWHSHVRKGLGWDLLFWQSRTLVRDSQLKRAVRVEIADQDGMLPRFQRNCSALLSRPVVPVVLHHHVTIHV